MHLRTVQVLIEHIEKVKKHIGDTPFTLTFYKYHAEITWFSIEPYYINWFINLQIPVVLRQENDTAFGGILYDSKLRLRITNKLSSVKPNWKLQHQRHQTVKLLQITG